MVRTVRLASATFLAVLVPAAALAYPLDGWERTHISRLKGNLNAQKAPDRRHLPEGALLGLEDVKINLAGVNDTWDLGAKDPVLQRALDSIFAHRDPSYGVSVIDITDPKHIQWAGRNENLSQYPGSVGKMLCLTAYMDGLRRAFPDTATRERIIRDTVVEAGPWVLGDDHSVPVLGEDGFNQWRPVMVSDRFTISEWLDHMISASANAAGSVIWKEAMLLRHFGSRYPVPKEEEDAFFKSTPKGELYELSQQIINEPLKAANLDTKTMKQGTFWTNGGQSRVPGTQSFASPRELSRLLLRIEQGKLVDEWSSREMKRYMYITKKRYRYCYAQELNDAAVFFKSGSLYDCAAEPGFRCGKYMGNKKNYMNSIAIIESPATPGPDQKRYIVAMMSNVLRVNSAWDHARVAAAIEEVVRTRKPTEVHEGGTTSAISDAGKGEQ